MSKLSADAQSFLPERYTKVPIEPRSISDVPVASIASLAAAAYDMRGVRAPPLFNNCAEDYPNTHHRYSSILIVSHQGYQVLSFTFTCSIIVLTSEL